MIIKAEYTPHYENDYAAASYESHAAFVKAADSFRTDYNNRFTDGYAFTNSWFMNPLVEQGEPDYPQEDYEFDGTAEDDSYYPTDTPQIRVHRMTR